MSYMDHATSEQRQAFQFAKLHDWGEHSRLVMTGDGLRLEVVDNYTLNSEFFSERIRIPATIRSVKDFGGY